MSKLYGGILVFGLDQCTSRAIKYMQLDLAILYNVCLQRAEDNGQLRHSLTKYRAFSAGLPTCDDNGPGHIEQLECKVSFL